jgi:hypothetical protein
MGNVQPLPSLLPLPLSHLVDYYVELLQIVLKVGTGGLLSNLSRITTLA